MARVGAWAVAIVLGFSFTTIKTTATNVLFHGWLADSCSVRTAWGGLSPS